MRAIFLSAALMRLCHPGPEARKCASKSASRRSFTACLGLAMRGRPRRSFTSNAVAGRTILPPTESCPRLAIVAVSGGPSSGSLQERFEDGDFLGIAFPHRDDATTASTRCPDHVDEATSQVALGRMAIFVPPIN